ncbi:carbohydrate kinase [Yersinia alsatica]|uniref:glycine-rich domain-containing protein n=1 Tax=Yersinia alsatica TaxID=2890317 RepID=UPI0011A3929D|nr:carbohydrate kinase [Yersinia alsatica]
MHRIDTPTAQTDKFGAGKNGFTRGNPQTGVPATALDDDYFDAVQEELAGIVEATGIVLDKSNRAQVLAAIKKLIGSETDTKYLKTGNNLVEIKNAGAVAIAATLANLGLGDGTGRLIGVKVFTSSGTYTPTAGTVSVVVEAIGAGGAGGGALVTTSSAISAAIGGAAGSYGKSRFTAIAASVAITVGSGGVAVNGGTGSNGGLSSFGSLLICPGGVGAAAGVAGTPAGFSATGPNSAAPTGANVVAVRGQGGGSPSGFSSPPNALGGSGGASFFGAGGSGENGVTGTVSTIGINPGSGGGGAASSNNAAVTKPGKNGADGIVIVWEYA